MTNINDDLFGIEKDMSNYKKLGLIRKYMQENDSDARVRFSPTLESHAFARYLEETFGKEKAYPFYKMQYDEMRKQLFEAYDNFQGLRHIPRRELITMPREERKRNLEEAIGIYGSEEAFKKERPTVHLRLQGGRIKNTFASAKEIFGSYYFYGPFALGAAASFIYHDVMKLFPNINDYIPVLKYVDPDITTWSVIALSAIGSTALSVWQNGEDNSYEIPLQTASGYLNGARRTISQSAQNIGSRLYNHLPNPVKRAVDFSKNTINRFRRPRH